MAVRYQSVAITTDALGAGTATFVEPVNGKIVEVRANAAQFSATADYAFVRKASFGGTVAYVVDNNGPFSVSPGIPVYDISGNKVLYGAAAGGTVTAEPYCAGELQVRVAQGGNAQSGTVSVLWDDLT